MKLPPLADPRLEMIIQTLIDAGDAAMLPILEQIEDDNVALAVNAHVNSLARMICAAIAMAVRTKGADRHKLVPQLAAYIAKGVEHLVAQAQSGAAR